MLSIGIFYTFTSPQYGAAKQLAAQAAEYENVIDNVSRISEARANLMSSYEAIPAVEKERLEKALPDNADAVGLARDLDTIASQYGIAIKSLQVSTMPDPNAAAIVMPDGGAAYDKATVSFSFVSNYPNFIKFLKDLEKSLRIMDVKSVVFQVGQNGLYEHQLVIETYWLK